MIYTFNFPILEDNEFDLVNVFSDELDSTTIDKWLDEIEDEMITQSQDWVPRRELIGWRKFVLHADQHSTGDDRW